MLQEFRDLGGVNLFVFDLAITVVFWLILTRRDNGKIKQLELLIQPYLRERKRKHECLSGKMRGKKKKKIKRERERRISNDVIRSLNGLKT